MIKAVDDAPTGVVLIENWAVDLPARTVTDAGTVAEPRLLESFTMRPPVGAGPDNATAPVAEAPPSTVLGVTDTELSNGGLTVSVAD